MSGAMTDGMLAQIERVFAVEKTATAMLVLELCAEIRAMREEEARYFQGQKSADREIERLCDLLAEAGSLLNAIRARDGTAYHNARYNGGVMTEYMPEEAFGALVERIRLALGGDILKAVWDAHNRRPA